MLLTLKDGSKKEFQNGLNGLEIASSLAPSLAKKCLGIRFNGEVIDYREPINKDGVFEILTKEDPEILHTLNHTCAHIMAQAVLRLYPGAQLAFGPSIEEGFYYDIKFPEGVVLSDKDFPKIEKEMHKIVDANYPLVREDISKEEGKELFKDQKFKSIHIDELEGEALTIYRQGEFADLCKGPHVPSTSYCKAFKLTALSGAYFHGDKNNDQLTRIYGVCFFSNQELEDYLKILEERKQSDHKRLGRELGLFMLSDYGPGMPFWLPNGILLREQLENWWIKLHKQNGYLRIDTPIMLNKELWETSGHWGHYKENMYITKIEEEEFAIKPMNCPGAITVYNNDQHSYKELPLRYAELGHVHRYEASGALNGLFRVRSFTQDDAHTLLRESQIGEEVSKLLALYDKVYSTFGLPYHIELSTMPEDHVGEVETWQHAESELIKALDENGIPYKINPGDGAFYGPKLDFKLRDSLGRIWQCGTIQLDYQLPGRFNCVYTDENNEKKTPIMIHRAIFGSIERFTGILIEHFKGAFPTWLAPHQVVIIPVNDECKEYAKKYQEELEERDIRVIYDDSDEKLGKKFRNWTVKKIPYILVIGSKEVETNSVTYRLYGKQEQINVSKDDFISLISEDIAKKKLVR